jgi:hypothetical protein
MTDVVDVESKVKTATELSSVIAAAIGLLEMDVIVYPCPTYGWDAAATALLTHRAQRDGDVKRSAAELRAQGYELKS